MWRLRTHMWGSPAHMYLYYTGGEIWEGLETCDDIHRGKWSLPLLHRPSKSSFLMHILHVNDYLYAHSDDKQPDYKLYFLYFYRIIFHPKITATI